MNFSAIGLLGYLLTVSPLSSRENDFSYYGYFSWRRLVVCVHYVLVYVLYVLYPLWHSLGMAMSRMTLFQGGQMLTLVPSLHPHQKSSDPLRCHYTHKQRLDTSVVQIPGQNHPDHDCRFQEEVNPQWERKREGEWDN